jgi:hypothetical protein
VVVVGGGSAIAGSFTFQPPTINSINPSFGPETGDTDINIFGESFADSMLAFFNKAPGMPANNPSHGVSCISESWCSVRTPPGSGKVDIVLQVNGVWSSRSSNDQFTYKRFPNIAKVVPTRGPATGGTEVSIEGTNFGQSPDVRFGLFTAKLARPCIPVPGGSWRCSVISPPGSLTVDIR